MGKNILIIDDDIAIQTILKDLLLGEGYLVDIEPYGRAGLNKIKTNKYDLLLIDIRLPDINGLELLQEVHKFNKDICSIMITAYPDVDTAVCAIRYGAYDYIQKPLNLEEIKYTIRRAFEQMRLIEDNKNLMESLKSCNIALQEEKKRRLTALWEGANLMGMATSLEDFFNDMLNVVMKVAQVSTCSIMLIDEKTGKLIIRAAKGLEEDIIKKTQIPIGEGISGWVVKNKEPVFVQNIEEDRRFRRKSGEKYLTKSLISVPLMIKDEAIGVLNVNNKISGGEFTEEDLQVITAIARQISITIENNRLYTEVKRVNREIVELQEQLLLSGKLATIGEIASIAAHEINTPLTTIMGYVNLLKKEIDNKVFIEKFISITNHEIDRITQITKRLLGLTGVERITKAPVDVNTVIKQTLLFLEHSLQKNRIELNLELQSGCPSINGNFNQLEQVILNMITNAIQAMPDGGKLIIKTTLRNKEEISKEGHSEDFNQIISTYSTSNWVEVSIADTGIGIPPENLKQLFKPFFTTKRGGTGLGLSICKRIISNHGGLLDVKSVVNRGTTFYIYLPIEI